jgi:hypothetical protein
MFCPQCSTHNQDSAKFCRTCGTNLEVVSMALAGHPPIELSLAAAADANLKKRREATGNVVQGSVMVGFSLLIGFIGFIFTRGHFPWLVIWTLFFSWMACWGAISISVGLAGLIGAKLISGSSNPTPNSYTVPLRDSGMNAFPPGSVTDHTTRQLGQK